MAHKGGDTRAAAAAKGKKVGRPRNQPAAVKEGSLSPDVAGQVLASIDQVAFWRTYLRADLPIADHVAKLSLAERMECERTLEYVTNRYHGKPAEKIEGSFDPDKPFVLTIEHIGRNPGKATAPAAKAK